MRIIVHAIDHEQPQRIGEGPTEGYWVGFESELTSGRALLVPSSYGFTFLNGRELSVETGWNKVEAIRLLPKHERPAGPNLVPLTTSADFQVTGVVEVVPADEESRTPFFYEVAVGDAWFTLTSDDVAELSPTIGDWLTFRVVGLVLWDEGL